MKGLLGFPPMMFVKEVIMKITLVTAFAAILPSLIVTVMNPGVGRLSVTLLVSVLGSMLSTFYLGLSTHERATIVKNLKNTIHNKFHN